MSYHWNLCWPVRIPSNHNTRWRLLKQELYPQITRCRISVFFQSRYNKFLIGRRNVRVWKNGDSTGPLLGLSFDICLFIAKQYLSNYFFSLLLLCCVYQVLFSCSFYYFSMHSYSCLSCIYIGYGSRLSHITHLFIIFLIIWVSTLR